MAIPSFIGNVVYLNMNNGDTVEIACPDTETAEKLVFALNECIADAVFRLQNEELLVISAPTREKLRIAAVGMPQYKGDNRA